MGLCTLRRYLQKYKIGTFNNILQVLLTSAKLSLSQSEFELSNAYFLSYDNGKINKQEIEIQFVS